MVKKCLKFDQPCASYYYSRVCCVLSACASCPDTEVNDLFFCQPVWWKCYCVTILPCPDITWGNSIPQKYLGNSISHMT